MISCKMPKRVLQTYTLTIGCSLVVSDRFGLAIFGVLPAAFSHLQFAQGNKQAGVQDSFTVRLWLRRNSHARSWHVSTCLFSAKCGNAPCGRIHWQVGVSDLVFVLSFSSDVCVLVFAFLLVGQNYKHVEDRPTDHMILTESVALLQPCKMLKHVLQTNRQYSEDRQYFGSFQSPILYRFVWPFSLRVFLNWSVKGT